VRGKSSRKFATKTALKLLEFAKCDNIDEAVEYLVSEFKQKTLCSEYKSGCEQPPYDPMAMGQFLGAKVVLSEDMSLEKNPLENTRDLFDNSNITIEIPTFHTSHSRKRFSIAHELGHIMLLKIGCPYSSSSNRNVKKSEVETLCNMIGAEILAPKKEVLKMIDEAYHTSKFLFSNVVTLVSEKFDISLHASIIRISEILKKHFGGVLYNPLTSMVEWRYEIRSIFENELINNLLFEIEQGKKAGNSSFAIFSADGQKYYQYDWINTRSNLVFAMVQI
jgi:hypothetical protein